MAYKGVLLHCGYRVDLVVAGSHIVEIKAVERLLRVHTAQVVTYLKLTGLETALLVNFNVPTLKEGLRRLTHNRANPKTSQSPRLPVNPIQT